MMKRFLLALSLYFPAIFCFNPDHLALIKKAQQDEKVLKNLPDFLDLSSADLSNMNFYQARLHKANFTNAKLNDSNLTESDILDTDFTDGYLKNTNLTKATIKNAILRGVDMDGSCQRETKFINVTMPNNTQFSN